VERISPAFSQRNIPIAFAANDFFVPYLSVMIYSIMVHGAAENNYDFVILSRDVSEENKRLLMEMTSPFQNVSLRTVDVTGYVSDYSFFVGNKENFSEESYYRLLIPEVMREYEKVLYFDGDMAALTDVAELYETELGEALLASSRDMCGLMSYYNALDDRKKYRDTVLKLKQPDDYFIAGMLIFNIPAFRAAYTTEELLRFAVSRDWLQHDQDVLNVLCQGRTKLVPAAWDVVDPEVRQYLPPPLKRELEESLKAPKIIHFGGALKPWLFLDAPYSDVFWKYAAQTPYIREIIRRRIQLDRGADSARGAMEEEFRQGKAGARYILRFIRAWLECKLEKRKHPTWS